MKTLLLLMLLAGPALCCDKGCSEYKVTPNHVIPCACNADTVIGEPVKPSDEKPRMSGQPVEQVVVIDKAKPAEATELSSGTFTWIWSETDRGIMPAVK